MLGWLLYRGCAWVFRLSSPSSSNVLVKLHPSAAPQGLAKGLISVSPAFEPSGCHILPNVPPAREAVSHQAALPVGPWDTAKENDGFFFMPKTLIQTLFPSISFSR